MTFLNKTLDFRKKVLPEAATEGHSFSYIFRCTLMGKFGKL